MAPFAHARILRALGLLCALAALVPLTAHADSSDLSGQLRSYRIVRSGNGSTATSGSAWAVQADLRGSTTLAGTALHASATLDSQLGDSGHAAQDHRVNEAYASGAALGWQWSAGKKVVSWDVGYGFRPNDRVQQEARRTLVAGALEGHPLLMAEHFGADTAVSLVWVNPQSGGDRTGAHEEAQAARVYWRDGAVDWHGFVHHGAHGDDSVGAAASWVASDAVELHASVRSTRHSAPQWLVGGTWTLESQVTLLAETWQGASAPLPTQNTFVRLSWQQGRWQPAWDVLYTPADRGLVTTLSVLWTGERVTLEAGLRAHGGPHDAAVRRAPVQRQAYVVASWAF